ncbi:hypothetical protein KSP40_PGU002146 [Platanthera guangdongensis]|uniref:Uncharacterized protein n=1 Tax=Platanthera guangdongensis TaxID=2320717 RepID=A0ABR2LRH8_9ASPA
MAAVEVEVHLLGRAQRRSSSRRRGLRFLRRVHQLKIEVGELKGRLTEVISNCDALCKRLAVEGPESLRASVISFSAGDGASPDPISWSKES